MRLWLTCKGWRTKADDRFARDHSWFGRVLCSLNGCIERIHVVTINFHDFPSRSRKARFLVHRGRHIRRAINRDGVIVKKDDQL